MLNYKPYDTKLVRVDLMQIYFETTPQFIVVSQII